MDVDFLLTYIRPELMILVVALYFIGSLMKKSTYVKDELIPFILWIISTTLCALYIFAITDMSGGYRAVLVCLFDILIQGTLCAAGSVFINQLYKQSGKLKQDANDGG